MINRSSKKKPSDRITRISDLSKALSEPVRIRMLMCLQRGPLSLNHFIDIFDLAPSTLSKHLHILESCGLISAVRQGRWRLYQWPEDGKDQAVQSFLIWMKDFAADDADLKADAAKRAVAVQKNPAPSPKSDRIRVLFVCSGNSCRSQMAEALLREKGGPGFVVESAGMNPREILPLTVSIMDEIGIDIGNQKPKSVMNYIGTTHFDYLITVCPTADEHLPVFPGVTHRLHWPMPDPAQVKGTAAQKKKAFRQVRDQLEKKISDWLKELALQRQSN
jgi:arsenate reductase